MPSPSILIIDFDPFYRKLYQELLEESGYQVRTVTSDDAARQYLSTERVDVLLADLQTPGIDGLDLLHHTRLLELAPDVIFVTGHVTLETAIEALKSGARDYLIKPFKPLQLLHLIKTCIDQRRVLDENALLKNQIRLYQRGQNIAALIELERLFPLSISTLLSEIGQGRGFAFLSAEHEVIRVDGTSGLGVEEAMIVANALIPQMEEVSQYKIFKADQLFLPPGGPEDVQTLCLFPLRCERSIKGGMVLFNPPGEDFAHDLPMERLGFLADQATLGFENAFRFQGARELIYTDDLTGLYNYRYLQKILDHEIRRSERYSLSFSLIFIDLDRFKRVNDTRGHLIGSDVLRECAALLHKSVRDIDVIFRYGGDEFTVLLVEAGPQVAAVVAERIRHSIEEFHFQQASGEPLRLTATVGYSTFPENATDKKSILEMADRAMYDGKSQRNIVRGVWEVGPA